MILTNCFASLKLYGREPEQFGAVNAMFQLVLADYPIEKVRAAFATYLRRHTELPAPADIATIIERNGKPPLERSVYISLTKKDAELRTAADWAYMRDFERYAMTGDMGGGRP